MGEVFDDIISVSIVACICASMAFIPLMLWSDNNARNECSELAAKNGNGYLVDTWPASCLNRGE